MNDASRGAGSLLPRGEELRRAVRWIAERRKADPDTKTLEIVEEASVRFDLTPLETEYLITMLNAP